jgi:hypothetical protein
VVAANTVFNQQIYIWWVDTPSLANMIDRRVRVFSNVDVDSARVGRNKYGFRRYLKNRMSEIVGAASGRVQRG